MGRILHGHIGGVPVGIRPGLLLWVASLTCFSGLGCLVEQASRLADLRKLVSRRAYELAILHDRLRRTVLVVRGSRPVAVCASRAVLTWLRVAMSRREPGAAVLASIGSCADSARVVSLAAWVVSAGGRPLLDQPGGPARCEEPEWAHFLEERDDARSLVRPGDWLLS